LRYKAARVDLEDTSVRVGPHHQSVERVVGSAPIYDDFFVLVSPIADSLRPVIKLSDKPNNIIISIKKPEWKRS
jgi:hypothetical protein